jgi:hypothetical protein
MSAAMDLAVINALRNDATLTALAPGGVYRDDAPENVVDAAITDPDEVFGVVTLQSALTKHAFETPAQEENRYLVKFVSPSNAPTVAQSAADRAETVLAALSVTGYGVTCSRREERIAYVEPDGPVRWQHRGVIWLVVAGATS